MRGRRAARRGWAVAVLLAATPAAAVPTTAAAPTDEAALRRAAAVADTGDCAGVLRLLDPVAAHAPVTSATRTSVQLLRMPCLAATGRGAEIPPVLAELQTRVPNHPLVLGFQVFADAEAGRTAKAADALAGLADTGSPALSIIPGSLWRALAQQLTLAHDQPRRERTALALARAGWTPPDQPELAETLALQGVAALLDEKDPDQAADLLKRVTRPGALWDMAIQRRFAPLWPAIETRLGPQSGRAADRYARTALDAFASAPGDDAARLGAARAFVALGRTDDVIATATPVTIAPGMGETRIEIVLADAQARAAAGDAAGAVARLEPFSRIDLAATPQAATALISLAELQHEAGRFEDERQLAERLLALKATPFSAFGAAWLRRNQACALAALGRAAEGRAAGDALKAHANDNEAAAIEGLLCLRRDDEAAAIAVAAFATPDGADRLADQFQPGDALFLHPRSSLRAQWARLLERQDVRAAFDRAARILPRALWPAAAPRAVPPPAASDDDSFITT